MTPKQIAAAKSPELVAFYNEHAEGLGLKPVKKFADLETARKRCLVIADTLAKKNKPAKAEKAPRAERAPKVPKTEAERAASIAASWTDPKIAAMRKERSGCKVKGQTFDSVRKAFVELGLPLSRHIRFRMQLKASTGGTAVFEHDGKSYTFTVTGRGA